MNIGQQVSHYVIQHEIGEGGFGNVYLARDINSGEEVALKCARFDENDNIQDKQQRFLREISCVSRLHHPGIIQVFDYGIAPDGTMFLAMEYVDGVSLETMIRQNAPFPYPFASDLVLQMLDALAEAHRQGVIHRDLKPGNIMVARHGYRNIVKILDFGIAKAIDGSTPDLTRQSLDGPKSFGTPQYMAPEQIFGNQPGPSTDLYAIGLVFYEMLVGKPAFEGKTLSEIVEKQLKVYPEIPYPFNQGPLGEVFRLSISKAVNLRYQTAMDMYMDINDIVKTGSPFLSLYTNARGGEQNSGNINANYGSSIAPVVSNVETHMPPNGMARGGYQSPVSQVSSVSMGPALQGGYHRPMNAMMPQDNPGMTLNGPYGIQIPKDPGFQDGSNMTLNGPFGIRVPKDPGMYPDKGMGPGMGMGPMMRNNPGMVMGPTSSGPSQPMMAPMGMGPMSSGPSQAMMSPMMRNDSGMVMGPSPSGVSPAMMPPMMRNNSGMVMGPSPSGVSPAMMRNDSGMVMGPSPSGVSPAMMSPMMRNDAGAGQPSQGASQVRMPSVPRDDSGVGPAPQVRTHSVSRNEADAGSEKPIGLDEKGLDKKGLENWGNNKYKFEKALTSGAPFSHRDEDGYKSSVSTGIFDPAVNRLMNPSGMMSGEMDVATSCLPSVNYEEAEFEGEATQFLQAYTEDDEPEAEGEATQFLQAYPDEEEPAPFDNSNNNRNVQPLNQRNNNINNSNDDDEPDEAFYSCVTNNGGADERRRKTMMSDSILDRVLYRFAMTSFGQKVMTSGPWKWAGNKKSRFKSFIGNMYVNNFPMLVLLLVAFLFVFFITVLLIVL